MTTYQIQVITERAGAESWEAYQGINATNDRAAQRCYDEWLCSITPHARNRFRLAKLFVNAR